MGWLAGRRDAAAGAVRDTWLERLSTSDLPQVATKLVSARRLIGLLASRYPDRRIHVAAGAAYAAGQRGLAQSPSPVTAARSRCGSLSAAACGRARSALPRSVLCWSVKPGAIMSGAGMAWRWWPRIWAAPVRRWLCGMRRDGRSRIAIFDGKQTAGVGQAPTAPPKAAERTAPFGFYCLSLAILWLALAGHAPPDRPTCEEIAAVRLAWAQAAVPPQNSSELMTWLLMTWLMVDFRTFSCCAGE